MADCISKYNILLQSIVQVVTQTKNTEGDILDCERTELV